MTYVVGVSDHVMIAHSLPAPVFGPAQGLHGATYEVRVEISAPGLDEHSIVIDIGLLRSSLARVLVPIAYQNLDELPIFAGRLTTTEVLCRHVHDELARLLGSGAGAELSVTLVESPVAWARYVAPLS